METNDPKLTVLVLIQAIDETDPLMGFFVGWLKRFASHAHHVIACGLRVSTPVPQIASNIEICALRNSGSRSRFDVIKNLLLITWRRRNDYDVVFVRGDTIYVFLMGWLWKMLGKKVVLWYAHHVHNFYLKASSFFIDEAITSVPEGYPHHRPKPHIVGQSIDEEKFVYSANHEGCRIVVFGRVMPSKYILEIIQEFSQIHYTEKQLDIIGPPSHQSYSEQVKHQISLVPGVSWDIKGVAYNDVPKVLARYNILVNANVGSLDKCIVESMMLGVIPVAASGGYARCLPADLRWLHARNQEERIIAIEKLLGMSTEARDQIAQQLRKIAIQEHSLNHQVQKIAHILNI